MWVTARWYSPTTGRSEPGRCARRVAEGVLGDVPTAAAAESQGGTDGGPAPGQLVALVAGLFFADEGFGGSSVVGGLAEPVLQFRFLLQ